jgi:Na+/pantothenate symporter
MGLFVRRRSARAALLSLGIGAAVVVGVFVLRTLGLTSLQEVYPGIAVGVLVYGVATRAFRTSRA